MTVLSFHRIHQVGYRRATHQPQGALVEPDFSSSRARFTEQLDLFSLALNCKICGHLRPGMVPNQSVLAFLSGHAQPGATMDSIRERQDAFNLGPSFET